MKLYIARHGETQWNLDNKISGRTDVPLTERGMEQARQLAEDAKGKGIDVILVSPLLRARQTAQAVCDALELPMSIDERLIELNFGIFEGLDRGDPDFNRYRGQLPLRFPGGESAFDLAMRVYSLLEDVKRDYADQTVLLVCHGGVCRMVKSYFEDMTNEEYCGYHAPNARLVEYEL